MPAPDPLYVAYDQWLAAKLWADFAGHALAGLTARGLASDGSEEHRKVLRLERCSRAAEYADAMLAEFRSRFHHEGK